MMTRNALASLMLLTMAGAVHAQAASNGARIQQCLVDNKDEKQTQETKSSYCTCMSDKMPVAETASVTEWESAHKNEQNTCAAGAKWNSD